jgi:hypothetical protein
MDRGRQGVREADLLGLRLDQAGGDGAGVSQVLQYDIALGSSLAACAESVNSARARSGCGRVGKHFVAGMWQ